MNGKTLGERMSNAIVGARKYERVQSHTREFEAFDPPHHLVNHF